MKNLLLLFLLPPALAAAQTTTTSRPRVSSPGALLDDYDPVTPGALTVGLGAFYSRVSAGDDRAWPTTDLSLGLAKRMDLSFSSSLTKSRFDTFRTTATGDSYISSKLVILTEGRRRPALTFQPVLEVLGRPSLANNPLAPDKVNGIFGGIVGKSFERFRVYNHSGYFTRGIFFSSAAVEFTSPFKHVVPAVFANYGQLTAYRDVAASIQNNVTQTNLGATLGFSFSKNWSGFLMGGWGIGRRDANTVDYRFGFGLSYTIRLWEPK